MTRKLTKEQRDEWSSFLQTSTQRTVPVDDFKKALDDLDEADRELETVTRTKENWRMAYEGAEHEAGELRAKLAIARKALERIPYARQFADAVNVAREAIAKIDEAKP